MSFVDEFAALPLEEWRGESARASAPRVSAVLRQARWGLADFPTLIAPAAAGQLEPMCRRAHELTRQRFGKVIRLFAPIYLSNECINQCVYCGFSREHPIARVTLGIEEVVQEARALAEQGFRNLLLVSGEHPKFVSLEYLEACVAALHREVPSLALEIAPLSVDAYAKLVAAGADGLVVYQETYDRRAYAALHQAGPKRDFNWRLATPERAYAAGFKRLGIGALFGFTDWRYEALALAAHAAHLLRHCWKAQLTISVPRLRPCFGEYAAPFPMTDRDLVQLVVALRLVFPDAGLVLSTRESPALRDHLIPLGFTLMSAGSHTEPGGYTGAGADHVHLTTRGRPVDLPGPPVARARPGGTRATRQFEIADERSPAEVAEQIRRLGYEPVWKDWDAALSA